MENYVLSEVAQRERHAAQHTCTATQIYNYNDLENSRWLREFNSHNGI